MSHSIYALLVGINHYKSPIIPPLKGCINDVIASGDFLKKRFANNNDKLFIKQLINDQATRQAVIDGFREHLCQAQSNDIALFYFSGHGSQECAAKEFWHLEPDHLNETLVCWDSRTDGIWDLADKEIAKLIAEVSQNHPHIVVILDCCHSAGGTRSQDDDMSSIEFDLSQRKYTGVRSVDPESRERPFSSFIFYPEGINNFFIESKENKFSLPKGEYILLAACRDKEKAREHYSQERGLFSYFLIDSLQKNGSLTYRDLFKRTNALVRSFYPNQSPQIEATNSSYLDQPFLGGTITKRQPYFTVTYHGINGWSMDGGAVHGIVRGSGNERTRLAIFPIDTENISQLSSAIAVAEITEVLAQGSKITISGEREELDSELTYKAVITNLPLSCLKVCFEGEESGIYFAREAIQKVCFGERPSLYVCEVYESSQADFYLQAFHDQYLITRASNCRQLMSPIAGFNFESALRAIQALEHIAKWMNVATLSSPANSRIQANAVRMQIYQEKSEIQDYQIGLEYQIYDGKLQPPAIRIKLTNTSDRALYCVLLDLTERFAISAIPFAGGQIGISLEPRQEAWALEGRPISVGIPENLWKQGVREYKDILKLIVSTSEFDGSLLEQGNIEIPHTRSSNDTTKQKPVPGNTTEYLIQQALTRAIVAYPQDPEDPGIWDDWVTSEILVMTVKPQRINFQTPEIEKPTQKPNTSGASDAVDDNKNLVHSYLFNNFRIVLILMFTLTIIFLVFILLQKSQQDKSGKPKISHSYIYLMTKISNVQSIFLTHINGDITI